MLTNRKKFRNRRKKVKIAIFSAIFIIASSVFLGYWVWTNILSKDNYISPLASSILSIYSTEQAKEIELEKLLKEKQIDFISIDSSEKTYIVRLKNDAEIILSQDKDLKIQISSLQFILNRLTMEGRQFSRLDLRYDKPVIVFK